MSAERGFFALILSLAISWAVFSRYNEEVDSEDTENKRQRYMPLISGAILPTCILCWAILEFIFYGAISTAQMTLSICFSIFLHISLYYAVLMLLLPFLRKFINARACATLWLIPNCLYVTAQDHAELTEPLLVIRTSGNWVWILFGIWLTGFLSVLHWKTISHLRFRKQVLTGSSPISDQITLDLWQQEIKGARIKKPKFQLVVSPNVSSPLTVGLFLRSMKVILPDRSYSNDELRLIFRHEIIHIGREDSWTKFFLMFCTAMCWFNPLMWGAMRRSADDLELSCDETVLLNADDETRSLYARLLLCAAGDDRGYTTCLSAAASSMRYRLKSVVKPRERCSGALIVGLTFFLLCMTCGYVALAYGGTTGEDVLFQHQDHSEFELNSISLKNDKFNADYVCMDQAAFNEYLAGLEMDNLTGDYTFSRFERQFTYIYKTPKGTMFVDLSNHAIEFVPLYGDHRSVIYYLPEGVDWDYLNTIIMANPAMNIHPNGTGDPYGGDFSAMLDKLTATVNGEENLMYESGISEEETSGIFGYDPSEVEFSFSYELAGPFTVEIENWDHTSKYTITQDELEDPFVVPLPAYPAHYRVYADFRGENGTIYKAEFRFEIGDINSA